MTSASKTGAREKLLDAAMMVIRERGYGASTVDEICAAAGVTKGAFFHHFPSKEDLAIAAAAHFGAMADGFFATAPYRSLTTAADRVLGYVAFRKAIIEGAVAEFSCLAGTLVQEIHAASDAIRDACGRAIFGHSATLEADIEAAMRARGMTGPVTPQSLARHTQTVLQGAFVLAKAGNDPDLARESFDHLDRYIRLLFNAPPGGTAP